MTHDLKTSLDDLAEAEYAGAPLSTVDIGRARAEGRRRMRTARLAPVGGGVAVVAACALVVNGLGGASPAKPNAPQTRPAAERAFTGTDPLPAIAKFGWLPDGFQTTGRSAGADYGDSVTASTKPLPASGDMPAGVPMLALTKSATEPTPIATETKAPASVTGSPKAFFIITPGDSSAIPPEVRLAWQTASGSWFILSGDYQAHGDELKAQLLKVADSTTAEDSEVALPIHVEGLPAGVTLGEAMLNDPVTVGTDGFTMGLSYHSGNAGPGTGHYFTISVTPTGQQNPKLSQGPDPDAVAKAGIKVVQAVPTPDSCKDSEGLHICVQDDPKQSGPDPLASVGGAQGLLNRITSLGTNPANWTTHVVN
ncbi:hypothetical protein ABH926_004054 [Catenulispora sp. GP43]|uniref:hypothetical protein n=1 Tax=Catenulispora sp. GP43 TaxID=3156263 RepID=UPI0035130734